MKADAAASTGQTVKPRQHGLAHYSKVFDQRKRRVRGLWERNGAFYAQLTVLDDASGKKAVRRTRLEDADGHPVNSVCFRDRQAEGGRTDLFQLFEWTPDIHCQSGWAGWERAPNQQEPD